MTRNDRAVYVTLPRKLLLVWLSTYVLMIVLVILSFQYTNYVSRQLCGVISISDDSYKLHPPPSETGRALAREFDKISDKYHCK